MEVCMEEGDLDYDILCQDILMDKIRTYLENAGVYIAYSDTFFITFYDTRHEDSFRRETDYTLCMDFTIKPTALLMKKYARHFENDIKKIISDFEKELELKKYEF